MLSDTGGAAVVDTWTVSQERSYNGGWSWHSGPEQQGGDLALESPVMDLGPASAPTLVVRTWYDFLQCGGAVIGDGGVVEVSSGAAWQQVHPLDNYPFVLEDTGGNPLAYYKAYSHMSLGWDLEVFDLAPWAGETIKVRFRAGFDGDTLCGISEGWYIDAFFLGDCPDDDQDSFSVCDGDCDDNDPAVFPGSDYDGDGYMGCGLDCNDSDSTISPGRAEVCGNCRDDDCDFLVDEECGSTTMSESEPNDGCTLADPVPAAGATISGVIDPAGDKDFFEFHACAGQRMDFDCDARVMGSNLDSVLELCEGSTVLARNDNSRTFEQKLKTRDSYLAHYFSRTGTYQLAVLDAASSGGPGYFYELFMHGACPKADGDKDGRTICDRDCDDTDQGVYKDAPEICDGRDNDCDDAVDDACLPAVFSDEFESGNTLGWTTESYGGTDLWHLSSEKSFSAISSLWCGQKTGDSLNYNAGRINAAVLTPEINLKASTTAALSFREYFHTEEQWDVCMVDVHHGSTWTHLRGGYGSAPSGFSGGWANPLIDLSPFCGSTVRIRFYFDTGDELYNVLPGWFIDDVYIYSD